VVDGTDLKIFNSLPTTLPLTATGVVTRHVVNPSFWEPGDQVPSDTFCVTFLPGSCATPALTGSASSSVPATLRLISGGVSWGGDFLLGRITVSSTAPGVSPLVIPFRLNFDGNAMFAVEPRGLTFRMTAGGALPAQQIDSLVDENV